ncbi:TlpA family protein disulfide reductase [Salinibacterium sp. SYSU T00001]|uniref:TlpA family protein disulfide reductase n=1 Tax=Homoserinimonas sedimenticola TaxID=2986805 RepID=UPI002235BEC4|nr:TlpA disulfide reductase family protein [Salinibacterium sedimenticola]MCW4385957.1 TlpA family protein disulfide reductase [Salinibacterium sedimenticola]
MSRLPLRMAAIVAAASLLLTGCTSDPLAEKYGNGGATNQESNDGAILEIAEENRAAAPEFSGMTDGGIEVSSDDYEGRVVVVNFWYAACGPCRAEAPDLEALHQKYKDEGVSFVGVNTLDQPENALAFARKYGITYPSIMDGETGEVRLAFAGQASPSAVPTTLVLDKEGRVAARFLGQITAPSNLDTIIRELVAEEL